jgi:hypothetical protein
MPVSSVLGCGGSRLHLYAILMYTNHYFPMYPKFGSYVTIFGALSIFLVLSKLDTVCAEAGKADSVDVIRKAVADLDQIDFGDVPDSDLGDMVIEDEA